MNSTMFDRLRVNFLGLLILGVSLLTSFSAQALPAFARQTGQNCVACHAGGQFPELTPYGRLFKLTGYTMGSRAIPVSAMAVASVTKNANSSLAGPKDGLPVLGTGSVFLAGKITDNVGIFAQGTFNSYGGDSGYQTTWGSDNFDLRFADRFIDANSDLIFGFSLNNNPTVSDVWNSAPAWIIYAPTMFGTSGPDSGPVVNGLGAQVAGLTAYAMWDQFLYAEVGAYKTANGAFSFLSQGTNDAGQTKLAGSNPYVRLAVTHEWGPHNIMIGVFGLDVGIHADPLDLTSPVTKFRDRGVDAQYQYLLDPHTVSAQFSYVRETTGNGIASGYSTNDSNTLNSLRIKGTYIYQAKYGASLSYFSTTGTTDSGLYSGISATNSPDTQGWTPEIFYTPIQNIRIGLQYYAYQKFDGASTSYNGTNNAKDNNNAFLYVWGAY